jgi:CubicO group peptidase (beta-lactamase class C family)
MTRDAIFRIYSMTKPFTSTVAMMLVEEGQISLVDPVGRYLPPLAKLQVGVEKGGVLTLVPAERDITIQDLLRRTSGFTYGSFGKSAVKEFGIAVTNLEDALEAGLAEDARKAEAELRERIREVTALVERLSERAAKL